MMDQTDWEEWRYRYRIFLENFTAWQERTNRDYSLFIQKYIQWWEHSFKKDTRRNNDFFEDYPPFPPPLYDSPLPPGLPPLKDPRPNRNDWKPDKSNDGNGGDYQGISSQLNESIGAQWKITSVFITISISLLIFFEEFQIESIFSALMVLLLNTAALSIIIPMHKDWLRLNVWREKLERMNFPPVRENVEDVLFPKDYRKKAFLNGGIFTPIIVGHAVLIIVAFGWVIHLGFINTNFEYYFLGITAFVGIEIWIWLLTRYSKWFNRKFKPTVDMHLKEY